MLLKWIYITFGSLSLLTGLIGVLLPVLPTTPFLILAAALYAKSSSKMYEFIVHHPKYGVTIRNYLNQRVVAKKTKIRATLILWSLSSITVLFVLDQVWAERIYILILIVVTLYIWSLKSEYPTAN